MVVIGHGSEHRFDFTHLRLLLCELLFHLRDHRANIFSHTSLHLVNGLLHLVLLLFKVSIHLSLLFLLLLESFIDLALDTLHHLIHLGLQMLDLGLHCLLEITLIDSSTLRILIAFTATALQEKLNFFFNLLIRLTLLLQDFFDAFVNLRS